MNRNRKLNLIIFLVIRQNFCCWSSSVEFFGFLLFSVSVAIEIDEEAEKENFVESNPPGKGDRKIAFDEKEEKTVHGHNNKLNHLTIGHVLFPLEKSLKSGSHRRCKIIRIHNDVNERIDETTHVSVSAIEKANAGIHEDRNDTVMSHVQYRHLVRFLA